MPFGPPIVWWMDASELGDTTRDPDKLKLIKQKIKQFDETSKELAALKDEIDEIINGSSGD